MVQPQVEFGTDFIEETVFLTVHELERQGQQMDLAMRFHEERSRRYEAPDEIESTRFETLYLNFFNELGLKQFFYRLLADFPQFAEKNARILIRRAFGRKSEGAELFVRGSERTVVTGLQTTRILDLGFLKSYLNHEWMRISDMLDPDFKYDVHASLNADNEIEENLNRDRFRVLWDLSIVSRLLNRGGFSYRDMGNLKRQFERVFSTWLPEDRDSIYDAATKRWPISQKSLIDFSAVVGRKRCSETAPVRCPLCHFTTYQLVNNWEDDRARICSVVAEDYPQWIPEEGMCAQCFELFRSRKKVGYSS
ncbi:MAG: hypothetical protein A2Z88_08290 [Omnitrophica WOR_2 bacterium GWA2_47_8]|nr:MAG: hypothetical protein A2Z88_08290 [Omnitrophica WOR_2 bacterium GWA2_47_8]